MKRVGVSTKINDEYYAQRSEKFTDNQFLNRYRKDFTSQFGEDGIIEKIFEIIGDGSKWAVEFGAWDGKHCSNTYNLLENKNWSGVLIEGSEIKHKDLLATHGKNDKVHCINHFVGWEGDQALDVILGKTPIPQNFDLLSVDIDSTDYYVWKGLSIYRPRVVIIEFNPCIPKDIEFVQAADPSVHQGTSILSMNKLAKDKGYELVCINAENAIYVEQELFPLFNIEDNSIESLMYYREPLRVFQLFDGTLVFEGEPYLFWYGLPVNFNKLQMLPRFVRKAGTSWGGNVFWRALIKILRMWRLRNVSVDMNDWKM